MFGMIKRINVPTLVASAVIAMFMGGTGAYAAAQFTGANVVNESLTGTDIKDGTVFFKDLSEGTKQTILEQCTAASKSAGFKCDSIKKVTVEDGVLTLKNDKGDTWTFEDTKGMTEEDWINVADDIETRATYEELMDLAEAEDARADLIGMTDAEKNEYATKVHANSVASDAENAAKGYADANDEVGSATVAEHLGSAATTIDKIGGPFAANATLLDIKHVDAGTYLVTSYAFFDRVDNSQSSTPVLQLAIRGVDGSQWGADYGTLFTNEFPATGNMEQSASATRYVTVPEGGLDVKVYGFGYNTNQSADGSGNYTVAADVNFVPVG